MASLGAQVRTWLTGILASGTVPIRGEVVLFSVTSDANQMVLCAAANAAKIAGVVYDPPGAVGKEMRVVRSGICLCKVNASTTVTQGDPVTTTTAGRIATAAAGGSTQNLLGIALESGAVGDLIAVDVHPSVIKLT